MSKGFTKFLLLLLLFATGVMIGMQLQERSVDTITHSPPSAYIERVEDGQPVYSPTHPPSERQGPSANLQEKLAEQGWDHPGNRAHEDAAEEPPLPVMSEEGRWDQIGRNLGYALTESAQKVLEIAIGFFVK